MSNIICQARVLSEQFKPLGCRAYARQPVFIHDNRMLAERAFYCYGIYPVEGIGVFRVPKNGDARNKKPPALRVETKRCTKKSPFRYNRVVQALL